MKKEILKRIGVGGFSGLLTCQIVLIFISLGIGNGRFIAVSPSFEKLINHEVLAFILQNVGFALIGITFALCGLFFEIARWSMLRQYSMHIGVTSVVWIPIVFIIWPPQSIWNILILIFNFMVPYVITWSIQYRVSKRDIEQINALIQNHKKGLKVND
ncbi:DUF3021 domain-containing protein [Ureibacillus acetophenoni]|uniref:DUF3021 domain-containing protein n=1 Tax=Ureibacillus acetophenoni TaxID=614649 RepID=A0A285UIS7_9BACL|nr:DUF3021 domain-containing protein [Ureibacillus acetophenoni]SOC41805.1 hypothetical protein SAMN05877842_11141 [Ureibacillus acetophenoni]